MLKNAAILLFTILSLTSCSLGTIDIQKIKVINYHNDSEKNLRLCNDLIYYNYFQGLATKLPSMTEEDAQYIRWEHFKRPSDQEVSFRIKLSLGRQFVKENRDKIIEYFKKEVEKKYRIHTSKSSLFEEATDVSKQILENIDRSNFDAVWDKFGDTLKRSLQKEKFIKIIAQQNAAFGYNKSRSLMSRVYSTKIAGTTSGEFFIITFRDEYSNYKGVHQRLILTKPSTWEIVGLQAEPIES